MEKQLNNRVLEEAITICADLQKHTTLSDASKRLLMARVATIHSLDELSARLLPYSVPQT